MVKSSMFATVFGLKQLAILTPFQVPFLGSLGLAIRAHPALRASQQLSFLPVGKSLVEGQLGAFIFLLKQGACSNLRTVREGNRATQ
jgi:hypothetical protein